MINSHQFQQAAKQFRAGRISLKEFTDLVISGVPGRKPNEQAQSRPDKRKSDQPLPNPLSKRPVDSHKGDFGRVVAIGGSVGMAGAISLTASAALRSGSGLVKVAVPEKVQLTVSSFCPCLMTIGCQNDGDCFHAEALESLVHHARWADVVALGPGLGRAESLHRIVLELYANLERPMVVDADGINVLVDANIDLSNHPAPRILTPHPGEFQRLTGTQLTSRGEMESAANQLAGSLDAVVVLKGNRTLVTDGSAEYQNDTGNPGMATAGSGDVLTGIVTALLGQGLSAFDAAALGVRVHGIAGDFAAEANGETSMIATDIIDHLPAAFKNYAGNSATPIGFQPA